MHTFNIINIYMGLLVICSIYSLSLRGMKVVESDDNKNVWKIISYNVPHDNYDVHRALSLVNIACHESIEHAHRHNKKRIETYITTDLPHHKITGARSWNKDFSKCAWVEYGILYRDFIDLKYLQLTVIGLDDDKKIIRSSWSWEDFFFPVFEDNIRPFFDKNGRACFYGCGKILMPNNSCLNTVGKYSIALDGKFERLCCVCATSNRYEWADNLRDITMLLNFPVLIKAILNSKRVENNLFFKDNMARYYISGVKLPENYKTYEKHVGLGKMNDKYEYSNCSSYDCLPEDLRQDVDDRYAMQQHEE